MQLHLNERREGKYFFKIPAIVFDRPCFLLSDPAAGATDDYGKGTLGAEFSFTTELRDTGHYGFLLPPDQIIPSGEEYMAAVEAGLKHLMP